MVSNNGNEGFVILGLKTLVGVVVVVDFDVDVDVVVVVVEAAKLRQMTSV